MKVFVIGSYVQACCWFVERIPTPGETLQATGLHIEAGGKGLNVAVGTRRLGMDVDAIFGIGEDAAGKSLVNLLADEGISSQYSYALSRQSGYGAGMIANNGQNAIAVYLGPNLLLNADHVREAHASIAAAQLVYGQFEAADEAVLASFTYAKLHGIKTVLNPSPWRAITPELLQCTDVMMVNEVELLDLLEVEADLRMHLNSNVMCLTDWKDFLTRRVDSLWHRWQGEMLVVTLGHLGSIAIQPQAGAPSIFTVSPAFQIKAVDTVGCGDAFASGFCAQFLTQPLMHTLLFANACGALVAESAGVLEALPNLNEVLAFLQQPA